MNAARFAFALWLMALALVSARYAAADGIAPTGYAQYLLDIQNLERIQAATPDKAVRYGDARNGSALKAVLDPVRALPMFGYYAGQQKNGAGQGDLPKLLQPAISRYEKAFSADHAGYEKEYLDSLDITAAIRLQTRLALRDAQAKLADSAREKNAAGEPSYAGPIGSSLAMMTSLSNLAAGADQALAASIRQQVAKKMFSREGGKRALHIADALELGPARRESTLPAGK
jgi:hypothetical protein